MLRRGMLDIPQPEPEHPLFGPTAQAQLRAIEVSDVWLGLRAGIEALRAALLSTPLRDSESLKERWGAIQQLSLLLHGRPQMILQHAQPTPSTEPEEAETPTYDPQVHSFDG